MGQVVLWLYRKLAGTLFPLLRNIPQALQVRLSLSEAFSVEPGARRIWFHAASAGELESLVPLIERSLGEGLSIVVSVFSPSALGKIEVLAMRWRGDYPSAEVLWGASPAEGNWVAALRGLRVRLFVTVKYEAWPDLWASLAETGIPLLLVGAQVRPSLVRLEQIFRWFGIPVPSLFFLLSDVRHAAPLRKLFPKSHVTFGGDPRWERVSSRLKIPSARVSRLLGLTDVFRGGRRVGVIGSVWSEDLDRVLKVLGSRPSEFLYLVPHDVTVRGVSEIEARLKKYFPGALILRSSQFEGSTTGGDGTRVVVLVDEMGYLAELYSVADWAYVGGGFGSGVHSTLEPAVAGVPISCGPTRVEVFAETQGLIESKQLQVVEHPTEFDSWLDRVDHLKASLQPVWRDRMGAQLGATERIWREMDSLIGSTAVKSEKRT